MIVYLLTEAQKNMLEGVEYMPDNLFNPIMDANGNWVITHEEVLNCATTELAWVKDLTEIEYQPAPQTIDC